MSALTELQLKNAKPSTDKAQYEIRDGKIGGLFVRISKEFENLRAEIPA